MWAGFLKNVMPNSARRKQGPAQYLDQDPTQRFPLSPKEPRDGAGVRRGTTLAASKHRTWGLTAPSTATNAREAGAPAERLREVRACRPG